MFTPNKNIWGSSFLLIILSFLLNIHKITAKESVPVLIWEDESAPIESAAFPAVHLRTPMILDKYLKSFQHDNIVIFLQDELSVEDLSSHESVFKNINHYMDNHHSVFLPTVESTVPLHHTFTAHGYDMTTLEVGSSVGELKLKKKHNLVVVKLPPTATNPMRKKALQKTDEVIGEFVSKVGKMAKFTFIFTGMAPSVKRESATERRRTSRSLKQSDEDPHNMHAKDCILLYLKQDLIVQKDNTTYYLYNNKTQEDIADCQENEATLIIKYKDLDQHQKVSASFRFVRTSRRWTLNDAKISEMATDGGMLDVFVFPVWPMEHVPLNKSYTCAQKLVFKSNDTTSGVLNAGYRLIVRGVQVQAFTSKEYFDDGWDCVGFFTIPIWTGIFAGFVMVLILAMGMYMLSEVKTMDRFDDPKSKYMLVTGVTE